MMSFLSWKAVLAGMTIVAAAGLAGAHAASGPSADGEPGFTPPFMHDAGAGMGHGMMPGMMHGGAMGMGAMGMARDSATMAQLGVIHELFVNHDRIRRTVANLPDGIRTTTESDDARIAQLIKDHVADMGKRVDAGNDPGLPIESEALHSIFKDHDKIRTKVEATDKGIVVVQTSTDAKTVAALQQHAAEVSDFVTAGMVAMRAAMMKNMRGMMPAGMHRGMPDDRGTPQPR